MNEYAKFTEKKTNATIKQFHLLGKKTKRKTFSRKQIKNKQTKTECKKQAEQVDNLTIGTLTAHSFIHSGCCKKVKINGHHHYQKKKIDLRPFESHYIDHLYSI